MVQIMLTHNILVVDDSATVRTRVRQILAEAGFRVTTAADGREAVELSKTQVPHLAVVDIEMPSLDGYGLCQELQQLGPPWSEVPIVFLTTLKSHALEMLGGTLGAYLQKPVSGEQLLNTITESLAGGVSRCPRTSQSH